MPGFGIQWFDFAAVSLWGSRIEDSHARIDGLSHLVGCDDLLLGPGNHRPLDMRPLRLLLLQRSIWKLIRPGLKSTVEHSSGKAQDSQHPDHSARKSSSNRVVGHHGILKANTQLA